jgi:hypothetical protein
VAPGHKKAAAHVLAAATYQTKQLETFPFKPPIAACRFYVYEKFPDTNIIQPTGLMI